ncbi:elongated mitochondria 1 [Klebsormidium nitens]|uniref:Elongated mitochondria 1 n=1 Tax=Klebsormidium nitens TaxID=105231 RepID=A0A1Y1I5Z9_KLENI|nr:elongated mitochondria 1 [Klebsormidium nitens]|eukprot:GAQ85382.1 elongated mitochondria 1 [Klebsormidium nitens]
MDSSGVPEIFNRGLDCVVRRAVIIGNGAAGAEKQCVGLVRALGLPERSCLLQRVNRPRDGLHHYLRWLPLAWHNNLHRTLAYLANRSTQVVPSSWLREGRNDGVQEGARIGVARDVPDADPEAIAREANSQLNREGPLLVVASGRDTWMLAAEVKRQAPSTTFVVQIQHPRADVSQFDLVITPAHDFYPTTPVGQAERRAALPFLGKHQQLIPKLPVGLQQLLLPQLNPPSKNMVLTVGALHTVDTAVLRMETARWHDVFSSLPAPIVAVSIGGPTRHCPYGLDLAAELVTGLRTMLAANGGCVRMTMSRRTPAHIARHVRQELAGESRVKIWDGRGDNPHLGHLAWADTFIVTADSVSMLSEACSTGKPVYVVGGSRCRGKIAAFHRTLQARGATRPFTGTEDMRSSWSYPPLTDTADSSRKIVEMMAERGWSISKGP